MSPTELELIAARDAGAMARFYDEHVPGVRRFCAALCPSERVDEAVEAAMVNFLARASEGPVTDAAADLLRKATREVAAGRMVVKDAAGNGPPDPVCQAAPDLIAALRNGELPGSATPLTEHLKRCAICQQSLAQFQEAEVAFAGWATSEDDPRAQWLALAEDNADEAGVSVGASGPAASPASQDVTPTAQLQGTSVAPPGQLRGRRGGLVKTVRELAQGRLASRRGR